MSGQRGMGRGWPGCLAGGHLGNRRHRQRALAIEVAHRQRWRFPGGVPWFDCQGGPAFDILIERIGAFCGIEDMAGLGGQGSAHTSGNLGLIHPQRGQLDEAEKLFRHNLEISQRLGDVHSIGLAFNALGQVFE
jgi:hypothetical protein